MQNLPNQPQQQNNSNLTSIIIVVCLLISLTSIITTIFIWRKNFQEKQTLETKIESLEAEIQQYKNNSYRVMPLPSSAMPILKDDPQKKPTNSKSLDTTDNKQFKDHKDQKFKYSFKYPSIWTLNQQEKNSNMYTFSGLPENHILKLHIWDPSAFGDCYQFGERENISIAGVSSTIMHATGKKPDSFCNMDSSHLGMTSVVIPLQAMPDGYQLFAHFTYEYPLTETDLAKQNLDIILNSFRFIE